MRTIRIALITLLISLTYYSVTAQGIDNAILLKTSKIGNTYCINDFNICYFPALRDYKTVEYFETQDTLFRDTLIFFNKKYTIDSFFFKESNYSGSFDLYETYSYKFRNKSFIIISFVNLFQMGTDEQIYYIIFQIENKHGFITSTYITNNRFPSRKVYVIKWHKTIKLKSRNLDELY